MRKRRPDLPWSDIESADELHSILAALDDSPQQLFARLRAGMASKVEQALAADLLERKIKPRRPRPGSHTEARLMVAALIRLLEKIPPQLWGYLPGMPPQKLRKVQRKALLHWARETVGHKSKVMKDRAAYNALIEFDEAAISQLKKPLGQMLRTPDPEMDTWIQALLTPDSELQMPIPDDDDDGDDGLLTPHPDA
jgi:hypothetical protein